VFGEGDAPPNRGAVRSHVASSTDGESWSKVRAIYDGGWWVWRVHHIDGAFIGAAYTAVRPTPERRALRILQSDDGLNWHHTTTVQTERSANETDFWFEDDGTFRIFARTHGDAVLFESNAQFEDWREHELDELAHAPVALRMGERTFVAGRARTDEG